LVIELTIVIVYHIFFLAVWVVLWIPRGYWLFERRTLQHGNRSLEWIIEWIKQALVEVVIV